MWGAAPCILPIGSIGAHCFVCRDETFSSLPNQRRRRQKGHERQGFALPGEPVRQPSRGRGPNCDLAGPRGDAFAPRTEASGVK